MPKTKEEVKLQKKEYDKKRREAMKRDPKKLEELKEKEKMKYLKKKEKQQVKDIASMTPRESRRKKKQWKINSKNYRDRKKKEKAQIDAHLRENTPPASPVPEVRIMMPGTPASSTASLPSTSRKAVGRKRILNNRSKNNRKIKHLEKDVKIAKARAERYKKRYLSLMKKTSAASASKTLSPNGKVSQMLIGQKVNSIVRKRLLFAETIRSEIENTKKKEKRILNSVIQGNLIRKYRLGSQTTLKNKLYGNELTKNKPRGKLITQKVKNDIMDFFESDENSKMCPGKKDCITKNKMKKQKRFLNDTLKNLYVKFSRHATYKISYATFCRLKPFWVVAPQLEGRETCGCTTHINMKLLITTARLNGLFELNDPKKLLEEICCDPSNVDCLLRKCENCKYKKVSYTITDKKKTVKVRQWIYETVTYVADGKERKVRKPLKKEINTRILSLVERIEQQLPIYLIHVANIVHQYKAIMQLKTDLPEDGVFMHVDFSENYSCKYNEEIQSFHFGGAREQISLHTGVIYTRHGDNLNTQAFCTLSKSLRHDAHAIWAHLKPIFSNMMKLNSNIQHVYVLSDGPVTQYKNKKMFYIMSTIKNFIPNIKTFIWNYSESGHGKGAPDGIGGTLKRTADRLVAQGKDIQNFDNFVKSMQAHCPGVSIDVVKEEDIQEIDLTMKGTVTESFPGTLKVHQVVFKDNANMLEFRSLSCFLCSEKCVHFYMGKGFPRELPLNERENSNVNTFNPGDWVVVKYDNTLYPGEVLSVGNDVLEVNAMMPTDVKGKFKWPPKKDVCMYPFEDVVDKLTPPEPVDSRGSQFVFPGYFL